MFMSDVYEFQLIAMDPALLSSRIDLFGSIGWVVDMEHGYEILTQVVIFSTKVSLVSVYRRLTDRLGRIIICWKITAFTTAITFLFCASQTFISLPG